MAEGKRPEKLMLSPFNQEKALKAIFTKYRQMSENVFRRDHEINHFRRGNRVAREEAVAGAAMESARLGPPPPPPPRCSGSRLPPGVASQGAPSGK